MEAAGILFAFVLAGLVAGYFLFVVTFFIAERFVKFKTAALTAGLVSGGLCLSSVVLAAGIVPALWLTLRHLATIPRVEGDVVTGLLDDDDSSS